VRIGVFYGETLSKMNSDISSVTGFRIIRVGDAPLFSKNIVPRASFPRKVNVDIPRNKSSLGEFGEA